MIGRKQELDLLEKIVYVSFSIFDYVWSPPRRKNDNSAKNLPRPMIVFSSSP